MRVGLAIETDSPGGAEVMVLELARQLLQHGHDVTALGPSGKEGWVTARFADMGIERKLVDVWGPHGLGSVPQIMSTIREHRLDVLHSHEFGMAVCGALAARLAGCRHVITMHGGVYYAQRPRRRMALRLASTVSSHLVAVSEASRRHLVERLGVPAASIDVVHNGVDPVEGDGGRVREELGVGTGDVLVVAVGNLYEVKGHATLLRAVSRLSRLPERIVVAIAGRGEEEPRLRALAAELGIAQNIHLLGYRADVPDLLRSADIFAMPSLSEGLPMAVIEAMLAGKAIVASNVGGIPELLPTSELGLLVRSGDVEELASRLGELARDPALRERLGAAARGHAARCFSASTMTERYLTLYRT